MLTSALFAGAVVGLLATLLHFAFVQNEILLAEQYESGALVHNAGAGAAPEADPAPAASAAPETAPQAGADQGAAMTGTEASSLKRDGLTALMMLLTYSAYAMLLVAGFGLAESAGQRIGPVEGLLWGLAGFATFQAFPVLGLAPELPGIPAPDLAARQIWWWGTVVATASAMALMGYGRRPWAWALAVALLAAPHLIGAPELEGFSGLAPPELASAFASRVLAIGLVTWSSLGLAAGYFWRRGASA